VSGPQLPEPTPDHEQTDWRRHFVEDMGGLVLVYGAPRALMRVLAWMVVCERPDQTATDIQRELQLSAGSVSTSLRLLGDTGLIERVAHPGDRRTFYRLNADGWERILENRFRAFTEIREVTDKALGTSGSEATGRLHEMRDTWSFFEKSSAELLQASRTRRQRGAPPND